MNGDVKSEWIWPVRDGPTDAEKATEFSVGASKASHNESVTTENGIDNGHDDTDMGNMVNGMRNGDMAALDSNSKLTSTYSDIECVIGDLPTVNSKLLTKHKPLPRLSCEKDPSHFVDDLKTIKEHHTMTPPSSPMLMALRDAVSSLSRMEDFEIIEEIGEGFYAKVYKVSLIN